MKLADLVALASFFSTLSVLSIGGSNSVVPELARHAVREQHWMTSSAFADVFAISQAAPGPSNLIVAMIGYKVAGMVGAVVAQAAMMVPAGPLMILVVRIWKRTSASGWHVALEHALGSIGRPDFGEWTHRRRELRLLLSRLRCGQPVHASVPAH